MGAKMAISTKSSTPLWSIWRAFFLLCNYYLQFAHFSHCTYPTHFVENRLGLHNYGVWVVYTNRPVSFHFPTHIFVLNVNDDDDNDRKLNYLVLLKRKIAWKPSKRKAFNEHSAVYCRHSRELCRWPAFFLSLSFSQKWCIVRICKCR